MSYRPGFEDAKCHNPSCGAWFYNALPYCPVCGVKNQPSLQKKIKRPTVKDKALVPVRALTNKIRRVMTVRKIIVSVIGAILTAGLWIMFPRLITTVSQTPTTEITAAAYSQLHEGMSYEDCAAIVGSQGNRTLDTKSPGVGHMTQVEWRNGSMYGLAKVVFVNGKLYSKVWLSPD